MYAYVNFKKEQKRQKKSRTPVQNGEKIPWTDLLVYDLDV